METTMKTGVGALFIDRGKRTMKRGQYVYARLKNRDGFQEKYHILSQFYYLTPQYQMIPSNIKQSWLPLF